MDLGSNGVPPQLYIKMYVQIFRAECAQTVCSDGVLTQCVHTLYSQYAHCSHRSKLNNEQARPTMDTMGPLGQARPTMDTMGPLESGNSIIYRE